MRGVILAAGEGKRLAPLTASLPKAIIPVSGLPMIVYGLRIMMNAGIKEIGIVSWYKDEFVIEESLQNFLSGDVQLTLLRERTRFGTAHALLQAESFVQNNSFCLLYCDHVSTLDLKPFLEEHLQKKPDATLLVERGDPKFLSSQMLLELDRVVRIVEKPKSPISSLGPCGAMILEPSIFKYLSVVKPGVQDEYHITDALQLAIAQGARIHWKEIKSWRVNVNAFSDVKRAEAFLQKESAAPPAL